MATYTMELRELIERGYHLALDDYPIFQEEYRPYLNQKIVDAYYFNEIGSETADRFNFYLRRMMNQIMPYYNKLYLSECLKFDPLATYFSEDVTENARELGRQSAREDASSRGETTDDVFSATNSASMDSSSATSSTDNTTENGGSTTTQTNDLTTNSTTSNTGSGTNDTSGTKTSVFSDLPQSSVSINLNSGGGGQTVLDIDGYATTATTDSSLQHDETSTTQRGTGETTNTGTVTTVASNDRTLSSTLNGSGSTTQDSSGSESSQRDIRRNENLTSVGRDTELVSEAVNTILRSSGRKGYSPSALLNEFRSTFLNIDMLIIRELGSLFMEVY